MEENVVENNVDTEKRTISRGSILLLAGCIILGILFDVLFYGKPFGISYPLFVLGFYGVLLWNLKENIVFKWDFAWILSIPILALSLTYLIYSNLIFKVLNFFAVPFLILVQTTLISKNNKYQWYAIKFVEDLGYSIFVKPFKNISKPFQMIGELISSKSKNKKVAIISKIFIGLLISIPLVMMVVVLLSSADQVFQHYTENILNFINSISLNEFTGRTLIALLVSLIIFSYIFSLITSKVKEVKEGEITVPLILDKVIMVTVLSTINLIYIFFVYIQFAYLFGGANYALPPSFTHSEYARRGFFELVVVTLINLSVLLVNLNLAESMSKIVNKISRILNSLLVVCTSIMLYSAHFRMSLYEQAYGYTYLRILTHAFMIFIFALLLTSLYKIWETKVSLAKAYIVIAITAYVILNYVNIDVVIARNNFERFQKTKHIDVGYISILSYDAVPWLIELMNDKNKDIAVEAQNSLYNKKQELSENNYWQSFNISNYFAKTKLSKLNLKYKEMRQER